MRYGTRMILQLTSSAALPSMQADALVDGQKAPYNPTEMLCLTLTWPASAASCTAVLPSRSWKPRFISIGLPALAKHLQMTGIQDGAAVF